MTWKAEQLAVEWVVEGPFSSKNLFLCEKTINSKMSLIFESIAPYTSMARKQHVKTDKNAPTTTEKSVFGQKLDNFAWTKSNIYTIYCIYQLCFRNGCSTPQHTWISVLDTFMDTNRRDYVPIELFCALYGRNGVFTGLHESYVLNMLYNRMWSL